MARADDGRLLEIEARFVRVNEKQARKAFGEMNSRNLAGVGFTPDQYAKALRTLSALKADFFSNPSVVTKSGQHAKVEIVRELRYPTEFDASKDEPGKFVPTAFETRNVGVTLEVQGTIVEDQIDLSIEPKVVSFLGFIDYARHNRTAQVSGLHPMAELLKRSLTEGGIWQPIFSTQKVTASVRVTSGQTILLGGMSLDPAVKEADANSSRTFVFIQARILPMTGAASPPGPASP